VDFILEFDIEVTSSGGNANPVGPGVGDTLGTRDQIPNGVFISYYAGFGGARLWIVTKVDGQYEFQSSGNPPQPNAVDITPGKIHYVQLAKRGGVLTLSVFSDPARTHHVSGSPTFVETTLVGNVFSFVYAVSGHVHPQEGNWEWTSGWIDNLRMQSL
jgi:hypothetical protein